MSEVIRISEQTYSRLESLARGFDTPGNVIDRLLDFYDQHHKNILLPEEGKSSMSSKSQPAGARRLGRRGYEQLTDYLIPAIRLIKSGVKHPDAFRRIADKLGVSKQTAQAECTVQLDHISTDKFLELINSDKIKSFLKERFPDRAGLVERDLTF